MQQKIIIYQKYSTKPIILTDNNEKENSNIKDEILEILKQDTISILETSNDILIIKPSEIQSILISKPNNKDIESPDTTYDESLKLEEPKK